MSANRSINIELSGGVKARLNVYTFFVSAKSQQPDTSELIYYTKTLIPYAFTGTLVTIGRGAQSNIEIPARERMVLE